MSGGNAHHGHTHGPARGTLTRRAALASVSVATILIGLKVWGAWATGSMAMLGSLADSSLDLAASLMTLFAVGLAAQPADDDHRFGHGKAEAIAALLQTLLIVGSAIAIGWRSILQLGIDELPTRGDIGIGVSLVGIALTLALVAYQRFVVARTGSVAIATDHLHYQSDLLLNVAVIAALGLDIYGGVHGADSAFGIGIAVYLAIGAVRSAGQAIDMLMDREWPVEKRQKLLAVVGGETRVSGVHQLRTRSSGVTDFIQFHVWLPPEMSVAAAHAIVDDIEARVAAAFPGAEILIHVDPAGHYDAGHAPEPACA